MVIKMVAIFAPAFKKEFHCFQQKVGSISFKFKWIPDLNMEIRLSKSLNN